MVGATFRWCLVGGLAIDRALGRSTRRHEDLDIAVFRNGQSSFLKWFANWELWGSGSPGSGLNRLTTEEHIPDSVHGIWCRRERSEPWAFEMLIEESIGDHWVYRRNHDVTLPIDRLICSVDGVPVMAPEVVLLYKGKEPRRRDLDDFRAALPLLDPRQRDWLKSSLAVAHPTCQWLSNL